MTGVAPPSIVKDTTPAGPPHAEFPVFTMSFVLIDQTTSANPYPGLGEFLPKLRDSLDEDLNQNFSGFHGGTYSFRVAADPSDRQPGEIAINLRHKQDGDPDGALGWHQVTGGVPDIEISLDFVSGLTGDSQALDVVASHEVKEAGADAGANRLADNGNGKSSALEACDRVEDTTYPTSNGLNASNFLLPAAWIPGAPGPYDFLQQLPSQLDANGNVTMTPGGYDIEVTSPTDYSDVTPQDRHASAATEAVSSSGSKKMVRCLSRAPIEGPRLSRKKSIYSRTHRRGAHL